MFIVAEHIITDPKAFWEVVPKLDQRPEGVNCLQSFPSIGSNRAVCLWEAGSITAVKDLLEPATAKFGRNEYFEVPNKEGIVLPKIAVTA